MQIELLGISDKDKFLYVQKNLEQELLNMEAGNGEFISLDDLDDYLEKTIQDFES